MLLGPAQFLESFRSLQAIGVKVTNGCRTRFHGLLIPPATGISRRPLLNERALLRETARATTRDLRRRKLLFASFPLLIRCGTIRGSDLASDTMAGLTVAAVAVPQAMAYAQIAGIPPQYGLYTAIVMTAVGALLDSSKQLINGPTNAISIAVFSAPGWLSATPNESRP